MSEALSPSLREAIEMLQRAIDAALVSAASCGCGAGMLSPQAQLRRSLELHQWNVSAAARELGVTRGTVYQRMKAWGITRQKVPKSLAGRVPTRALTSPR